LTDVLAGFETSRTALAGVKSHFCL
jgi:hypothetical protein